MDSSDDRHPTEEQHRSAEQKHWDWQERTESSRDKIGRITLTLSVIAFGVACISLWQSYRQADAAQGQLEAMRVDARAWVAPVDINFIGPVQSGKTISLSIKYQNFGREPARNFFSNMLSARQFTRANWLAETEPTDFIKREKAACFATDPLVGLGIVWPSSGGEPINLSIDLSSASRPKEARSDFSRDVVDGSSIFSFYRLLCIWTAWYGPPHPILLLL